MQGFTILLRNTFLCMCSRVHPCKKMHTVKSELRNFKLIKEYKSLRHSRCSNSYSVLVQVYLKIATKSLVVILAKKEVIQIRLSQSEIITSQFE